MSKSALALVLLVAAWMPTTPALAEESPYNKGVAAWRVQDYAEARKQWETSLAQGGPDEALNNLAFLLYNGLGGKAEPERAVELWRKGAALAVSEAQWHLGEAYEQGRGVARNRVTAYAWYLCAVATAEKLAAEDETEAAILEDASESRDHLAQHLAPMERASGERLAQELITRYAAPLSLQAR